MKEMKKMAKKKTKKRIKADRRNLKICAIIALLLLIAFTLGIRVAPYVKKETIAIEVEVSDEELQGRIYNVAKAYCDIFREIGYDLQSRAYDDVLRIPIITRVNSSILFSEIAESNDVSVIYISYTELPLRLPIFWFAYYDEVEQRGALITWSPYW